MPPPLRHRVRKPVTLHPPPPPAPTREDVPHFPGAPRRTREPTAGSCTTTHPPINHTSTNPHAASIRPHRHPNRVVALSVTPNTGLPRKHPLYRRPPTTPTASLCLEPARQPHHARVASRDVPFYRKPHSGSACRSANSVLAKCDTHAPHSYYLPRRVRRTCAPAQRHSLCHAVDVTDFSPPHPEACTIPLQPDLQHSCAFPATLRLCVDHVSLLPSVVSPPSSHSYHSRRPDQRACPREHRPTQSSASERCDSTLELATGCMTKQFAVGLRAELRPIYTPTRYPLPSPFSAHSLGPHTLLLALTQHPRDRQIAMTVYVTSLAHTSRRSMLPAALQRQEAARRPPPPFRQRSGTARCRPPSARRRRLGAAHHRPAAHYLTTRSSLPTSHATPQVTHNSARTSRPCPSPAAHRTTHQHAHLAGHAHPNPIALTLKPDAALAQPAAAVQAQPAAALAQLAAAALHITRSPPPPSPSPPPPYRPTARRRPRPTRRRRAAPRAARRATPSPSPPPPFRPTARRHPRPARRHHLGDSLPEPSPRPPPPPLPPEPPPPPPLPRRRHRRAAAAAAAALRRRARRRHRRRPRPRRRRRPPAAAASPPAPPPPPRRAGSPRKSSRASTSPPP